jgi:hypothetical protein
MDKRQSKMQEKANELQEYMHDEVAAIALKVRGENSKETDLLRALPQERGPPGPPGE